MRGRIGNTMDASQTRDKESGCGEEKVSADDKGLQRPRELKGSSD